MNYCLVCGSILKESDQQKCNNDHCPFRQASDTNNGTENSQPDGGAGLSHLRIIKGAVSTAAKRLSRMHDLLVFSNAVLWPDITFSERSRQELLPLIEQHFRGSQDIDQRFRELIERTVLGRCWVDEKAYRFIPEPKKWFNNDRIDGLYSTHTLYGKMLTMRNSMPLYEVGISLLSTAVQRYFDDRNILDVTACRQAFILFHRLDLLQYYYNTIMHIQFINL